MTIRSEVEAVVDKYTSGASEHPSMVDELIVLAYDFVRREKTPREEVTDLDKTITALQRGEPVIANVTLSGAMIFNEQDHAINALGAKIDSCTILSQADPAVIPRGSELIAPYIRTPNGQTSNANAYYGLGQ